MKIYHVVIKENKRMKKKVKEKKTNYKTTWRKITFLILKALFQKEQQQILFR